MKIQLWSCHFLFKTSIDSTFKRIKLNVTSIEAFQHLTPIKLFNSLTVLCYSHSILFYFNAFSFIFPSTPQVSSILVLLTASIKEIRFTAQDPTFLLLIKELMLCPNGSHSSLEPHCCINSLISVLIRHQTLCYEFKGQSDEPSILTSHSCVCLSVFVIKFYIILLGRLSP